MNTLGSGEHFSGKACDGFLLLLNVETQSKQSNFSFFDTVKFLKIFTSFTSILSAVTLGATLVLLQLIFTLPLYCL